MIGTKRKITRRRPRTAWGFPHEEKLKFSYEDFLKAKREGKPLMTLDVEIKCLGGKVHKIRMRFPGRVTLLHHPDIQAEKTMIGLGGDTPECLAFLEKFKESMGAACAGRYYAMKFLVARDQIQIYKNQAKAEYTDMFSKPLENRLRAIVDNLAAKLKKSISNKWGIKTERHSYSWNRDLDVDETVILPNVSFKFVDRRNKPTKEDSYEETD